MSSLHFIELVVLANNAIDRNIVEAKNVTAAMIFHFGDGVR